VLGADALRTYFENSPDAIWLFDPSSGVFVDCNDAAVAMMHCESHEQLLQLTPVDFAPERQMDGRLTTEAAVDITRTVAAQGSLRFEWLVQRPDGTVFPIEALSTVVPVGERRLHLVVARDISERKRAEESIRELNASLEQRIQERTAELSASQERLRTLVEHAPEAIVVFDGETGRFVHCNENATRLFGLSREDLLQFTPDAVSPLAQPDGRLSVDAARSYIDAAIAGETPMFEWVHKDASGRLFTCEVRLVKLPGPSPTLVRGSIIDMTDQKRREKIQRATYRISEAVHATEDLDSLYERIHEIIKGLMPADNFYLALYDSAADQHYYAYHVDEADMRPAPRKMEGGLNGYVLSSGKALLANRASMTDPRHEWRLRSGTPSAIWLGVPLNVGGRTAGVMAVQDYHDENAYGEEEKKILTFVAAQIASAIERKRREAVQRATYRISEAVQNTEDLDSLYASTHEIVRGLMPAENFYIALLDPATQLVSFPYYVDQANPVAPLPRQINTGLTGYVLRAQTPVLVSRAHNQRKEQVGDSVLLEGLQLPYVEAGPAAAIWLGVPLSVRGKTIGVMAVQDYDDEWAYGAQEKEILSFVASQVASSIDRRRGEQALKESEEKFRALFEASSQGVMLHDEEQFIEVNPATLRILGFDSMDEIVGHHPAEFAAAMQPGGEPPEVLAKRYIERCMTTGNARFDWICRNPKGREIPIEVILTRIQMSGRQIIQAVINDITHRKQAEAELLRSLAREKELGQLKSSFVSMVSHEFRTPLAIIMSSAEILRDYLEQLEPEERRQHLQSIQKNTRRMAELMEEVLLLGRFDAGRMEFEPAEMDLRALGNRTREEVLAATDRACEIDFRIDPGITNAKSDERLLRHIFTNLLTNAVKYSEPGSNVEFVIERRGRNAVCRVKDRGIGIPESDQAGLFKAFQRGGNVGQRPGTGLGLVIVKRCVELHGGEISVESKVGEGTTFTVTWLAFL
jgi:PAS domain S-box-containing protein